MTAKVGLSSRSKTIIMVNPGVQPELQRMAEGLAANDSLKKYVTALSFGHGRRSSKLAPLIPRKLREKARRQLTRRAVDIPDSLLSRKSTIADLGLLALHRVNRFQNLRPLVINYRNHTVQRAAKGELDDGTRLVIGRSTSALRIFTAARARGVTTLLDYPIGYHRWLREELEREIDLQPRFRDSLRAEIPSEGQCRLLDAEIELADRVLSFNDFHSRTFTDYGISQEKMVVQHLGVDLGLFHPKPASPDGTRPFTVLFVGQITQRKGIAYALKAFQEASLGHAELVFVGRPVGTALNTLNLGDASRWISHVDRRALPDIYNLADVFLFPSLVEGFAQTPLEAMACGLPVITTQNAVGSKLIEHGASGFLVEPRDVGSMVTVLELLRADSELRTRISIAASERVRAFDNRYVSADLARLAEAMSLVKVSAPPMPITSSPLFTSHFPPEAS